MDETVYLLELAVMALSTAEISRLNAAVEQLSQRMANVEFHQDREAGQFLLRRTDEAHLKQRQQAVAEAMRGRVKFGAPQIVYVETLSRSVTIGQRRHPPI